jgi:hypothetical protein
MIEGVNALIANAANVRVEQTSVIRSFAANPGRVQEAASAPQAPYVSPYIHLDLNYDKAVLQIRDGDTGDVVRQYPSESSLESTRRAIAAQQNQQLASEGEDIPAPRPQQRAATSSAPTPTVQQQAPSQGPSTTGVNAEAQVAAAALASTAAANADTSTAVSITA